MNTIMNTVATPPRAKAMGMPENSATRVDAAVEQADRAGAHCGWRPGRRQAGRCRVRVPAAEHLQQQLHGEQRHPRRHAAVRDPQRRAPRRGRRLSFVPRLEQELPALPGEEPDEQQRARIRQQPPHLVDTRRQHVRQRVDADMAAPRLRPGRRPEGGADQQEGGQLVLPVARDGQEVAPDHLPGQHRAGRRDRSRGGAREQAVQPRHRTLHAAQHARARHVGRRAGAGCRRRQATTASASLSRLAQAALRLA